jgi:hypothetical protein
MGFFKNADMKLFLTTCLFFATLLSIQAQTRTLNVQGGYGSGTYQVGDTVHIWSEAYDFSETFATWTGDIQFLERAKEWHTTLIMPNQDVSVTATRVDMPPYSIEFEQIMGANNLKDVYYHFPTNPKGIIFFFHGTNGSASNLVNNEETRSFLNAAIADSYGVIITESEETTLNTDLNADGKLRWKGFPLDTINGVDFLNIKAVKDTFISRNDFTSTTPLFSVGISNGGSFSAAVSQIYNFKAGVSYIASSVTPLFEVRENPFAFRMALYDDHEEVGPAGNYQAWQHDSILQAGGICHDYEIHNKQPIYPQRFARIQGISLATSTGIYTDLLTNGELDANTYALHSDTIKNHVLANPSQYPSISGLSTSLQMSVLSQIGASNAEHKFYSDLNHETLEFFNTLCSPVNSVNDTENGAKLFDVYPNPASQYFQLKMEGESVFTLRIFNMQGNLVHQEEVLESNTKVHVQSLQAGLYLLQISNERMSFNTKISVSR